MEEDDIRAWHMKSVARGVDQKPGPLLDGVTYCWNIGGKLIEQFDTQESSEEESEGEDDSEDE